MRVVVSHPTGNTNVRNLVRGLADEKILGSFETTIACFQSGFWHLMSRLPPLREIRRRTYDEDLRRFVRTAPALELLRLAAVKLGVYGLTRGGVAPLSIDRIYQALDRKTAKTAFGTNIEAFYCYEDGALSTFKAAKMAGKRCLYDLPIGYWRAARRILSEEAERRPEWQPTMDGLQDSPTKLTRKDEELRLADRIVVASTFTKATLRECPFGLAPISVVSYGADDAFKQRLSRPYPPGNARLRVLFVGGLSQRKGVADLLEAVNSLMTATELTIIGRKVGGSCPALDAALGHHRWIESLPRERILREMSEHDVLVFPSLFEGFGLVVTEALSQGLPVITTSHTCGPDVLTEGEDGFIVPIRDPQAIAEKLELLHRDRDLLAAMSEAARRKAESLTWESYRQGIVGVVREALAA